MALNLTSGSRPKTVLLSRLFTQNHRWMYFAFFTVDHCETLNSCPEDEPMMASDEGLDAATDESLLETNPIQSPLQVFAGMGGLALIAERLPMLYPDVIQQVSATVM